MTHEPAITKDDLHGMVSGLNEAHARSAIRDLLHEHDGDELKVRFTLSLWVEEEADRYNNTPPAPVSKDWTS